jgi:two-component system OmpR family sensor kinase
LIVTQLRRLVARASTLFDRLPIRTRLAVVSALLTFAILCVFALTIGSLTAHRIRADFNHEVSETAKQLPNDLRVTADQLAGTFQVSPPLRDIAPPGTVIRILYESGRVLEQYPVGAPAFHTLPLGATTKVVNEHGYRVVMSVVHVEGPLGPIGRLYFQYARQVGPTEATVKRVELLLVLGVLAGTALALLAGVALARRAMKPIAELTSAADEIARTRDSSATVPQPLADDEVSELARTLQGMLRSLDSAHAETEAALTRQRQFIADASHELRTPLTSVLANLELLTDTLRGEEADTARSALRSSKRMRRLVADLLLLARSDVGRVVHREPVDLAQTVIEAAAELGPVSASHEISLDVERAGPVSVMASRDELHRLTINLIENALRHTPAGSSIWVSIDAERRKHQARLVVADNGPGVPEHLAGSLFERFVRGAGDRGGSFGLGLAIVKAVAESHGGSVTLERTRRDGIEHGARFVVRLPLAPQQPPADAPQVAEAIGHPTAR